MKNLLICTLLFALLPGCSRRQQALVGSVSDTVAVASLDTLAEDTLAELFFSPVEEIQISGRDGLFEEFLSEFVTDTTMWKRRTLFPLPYVCMGEECMLNEVGVFLSHVFGSTDSYYTLFESDAQIETERDTSLTRVGMECIDMENRKVCVFSFEKQDGCWHLFRMDEMSFEDYRHREFFAFYYDFVSDSLYQSRHVNDPMTFVTLDPEDDFNVLEANIDMEQWFAFHPMLSEKLFVNINYGVKPSRRPKRKVLTCKSYEGNFSSTFYFRKMDGEWMLTRFEDMSN